MIIFFPVGLQHLAFSWKPGLVVVMFVVVGWVVVVVVMDVLVVVMACRPSSLSPPLPAVLFFVHVSPYPTLIPPLGCRPQHRSSRSGCGRSHSHSSRTSIVEGAKVVIAGETSAAATGRGVAIVLYFIIVEGVTTQERTCR